MLPPRKRWIVTRHVFQGVPFRLDVPAAEMRLLELKYLEFVRSPRTPADIEAMLAEATDCPVTLVRALKMTIHDRLFLGSRTGRGGRLVVTLPDRSEQMTDLGATWVQQEMDKENGG